MADDICYKPGDVIYCWDSKDYKTYWGCAYPYSKPGYLYIIESVYDTYITAKPIKIGVVECDGSTDCIINLYKDDTDICFTLDEHKAKYDEWKDDLKKKEEKEQKEKKEMADKEATLAVTKKVLEHERRIKIIGVIVVVLISILLIASMT